MHEDKQTATNAVEVGMAKIAADQRLKMRKVWGNLEWIEARLRSCPFCGAGASLGEDNDGYAILCCAECPAQIGPLAFTGGRMIAAGVRDEAIAAWNRRFA
jgi:hypothetical protein